jgi:pilus assembly protein CpaF
MMSDVDMPLAAIRMQIGSGIGAIVQVDRLSDGSRKLTQIAELVGYDADTRRYELRELFVRDELEAGALIPTGLLPACSPQLRAHGQQLPAAMMQAAERRSRAEG